MDVNAAVTCGVQTQMGGEHSKLARGAQQIGAWTQVQTDNKLTWRKRIARSSLIRRWAHSVAGWGVDLAVDPPAFGGGNISNLILLISPPSVCSTALTDQILLSLEKSSATPKGMSSVHAMLTLALPWVGLPIQ